MMIQYATMLALIGLMMVPIAIGTSIGSPRLSRVLWAAVIVHISPVMIMLWARMIFGSGE